MYGLDKIPDYANYSYDPFYNFGDFDFDEDDPVFNEKGYNFSISSELEDTATKADWAKTSEYFQTQKGEYYEGKSRLERNYIREQENERKAEHSREQKDNESR